MTAKELYEKYEKDLKDLQDNCKHGDVSDWLTYYWAPGHSNSEAKQCNICHKIMETRNDWESMNNQLQAKLTTN